MPIARKPKSQADKIRHYMTGVNITTIRTLHIACEGLIVELLKTVDKLSDASLPPSLFLKKRRLHLKRNRAQAVARAGLRLSNQS